MRTRRPGGFQIQTRRQQEPALQKMSGRSGDRKSRTSALRRTLVSQLRVKRHRVCRCESGGRNLVRIMARLQEKYFKEVLPRLAKHFGRENPHSLPRLKKIVVNMGVGQAS